MNVDRCRSCTRAIIWTTSPTGARLPVDARPVTVYTLEETGDTPNAVKHDPTTYLLDNPGEVRTKPTKLYVSHFVSCPAAGTHSGRSRG